LEVGHAGINVAYGEKFHQRAAPSLQPTLVVYKRGAACGRSDCGSSFFDALDIQRS
jgi:hypothetical protein